ncbi:uncharacterized protein VTP21DRAFT_11424 [Calcarisporiella thermophila]|uniref:uncharacterized protein n=1 Tax=Calcarisporiella thermophila TaxID=911321 RepID=UPI003743C2D4
MGLSTLETSQAQAIYSSWCAVPFLSKVLFKITSPVEMGNTKSALNYRQSKCEDKVGPIEKRGRIPLKRKPLAKSAKFNFEGEGQDCRIVHGRKLLNIRGLRYILPQDEEEAGRLQARHYVYKNLLSGNFSAPVQKELEEGIRVLDAGCGPGSWTMEMAAKYRKSTFIGVDICSQLLPLPNLHPTNCIFRQVNLGKPLPFPNEHFDYIYMRAMGLAFTSSQWRWVLKELRRVLKPGGSIEWIEYDLEFRQRGPAFTSLNNEMWACLKKNGIDPVLGRKMVEHLSSAGFKSEAARSSYVSVPLGRWGGWCGEMARTDFISAMRALRPAMLQSMNNTTNEEIEAKVLECLDEFEEYKTYMNIYLCVARKEHRDAKEELAEILGLDIGRRDSARSFHRDDHQSLMKSHHELPMVGPTSS